MRAGLSGNLGGTMQAVITALSRLNNLLTRLSLWLAGIGLVAMTVIVFAQVFARYVMGYSLLWVEPVAILLMSWFIFLGSAVGVHEKFHLGFDVLIFFLPERFGSWLRGLSDTAVLVFGIGMVVYGWQLMAKTWGNTLPIIRLPGGVSYLPLFVGGVLIVLFVVEHLLNRIAGRTEEARPDADDVLASEV